VTARRTRGNLWLLLALLPLVSVSCWFCLREDDSVAPAPSSPEPSPPSLTPAATVEVTPIEVRDERDAGQDAGVDAGSDAGVLDAGVQRTNDPSEADIAAYIAKWRSALEPVLRSKKHIEPQASVSPEPKKRDVEEPDAGCQPGRTSLLVKGAAAVDLVVAVDTSGSMMPAGLDAAADFLGRLEYRLVERGVDYHLIVLAEPDSLRLTTDAGVSRAVIGSNDGLDVLLRTARENAPGWLQFTRPEAVLKLVLITDDRPWNRQAAQTLSSRLAATLPMRSPSFNIVGGFDAPTINPLLWPGDPVSTQRCAGTMNGAPLVGMDHGLAYQQVAVETGGFRASICVAESRARMIDVLSGVLDSAPRCEWSLNPQVRVRELRAKDHDGNSMYLIPERGPEQCRNLQRSYYLAPPMLVLCPATCTELTQRATELSVDVDCFGGP
jgi:hypothetical protein